MSFLGTASRVSALSFFLGASIEWFMLHVQVGEETFYDTVTRLEAERRHQTEINSTLSDGGSIVHNFYKPDLTIPKDTEKPKSILQQRKIAIVQPRGKRRNENDFSNDSKQE
eukprot:gene7415-527_t